jgi:hypothetical protein
MLVGKVRRTVLVAAGSILVAAILIALALAVWPFLRYPGTMERTAAEHLNNVEVDGFEYIGEDATVNATVSRFWVLRGTLNDPASAVKYDGKPLRRDYPGLDSPPGTRFEEELGWLPLAGEVRCGLSASRVKEQPPIGANVELSGAEWLAVEAGTVTMIRVVVTCGGG